MKLDPCSFLLLILSPEKEPRKYIPFAFLIGIVLNWRPRSLPYFAIIHVLINMSLAPLFLAVAY